MKLLAPERKYLLEMLQERLGKLTAKDRTAETYIASGRADKKWIAYHERREAARIKKAAMVAGSVSVWPKRAIVALGLCLALPLTYAKESQAPKGCEPACQADRGHSHGPGGGHCFGGQAEPGCGGTGEPWREGTGQESVQDQAPRHRPLSRQVSKFQVMLAVLLGCCLGAIAGFAAMRHLNKYGERKSQDSGR